MSEKYENCTSDCSSCGESCSERTALLSAVCQGVSKFTEFAFLGA